MQQHGRKYFARRPSCTSFVCWRFIGLEIGHYFLHVPLFYSGVVFGLRTSFTNVTFRPGLKHLTGLQELLVDKNVHWFGHRGSCNVFVQSGPKTSHCERGQCLFTLRTYFSVELPKLDPELLGLDLGRVAV